MNITTDKGNDLGATEAKGANGKSCKVKPRQRKTEDEQKL